MAFKVNTSAILMRGSQNFNYTNPAVIGVGATTWYDITTVLPEARFFLPLDSITVTNNSAVQITILLNSPTESISIPSYMIKPIAGKPVRRFGIQNDGAAQVAIGEIIFQLKRLPPDITVVTNA